MQYSPVSFAHTLGVRTFDVLFDDLFPSSSAQPSSEETLHFLDLAHLNRVLDVESSRVREYKAVFGLSSRVRARRSTVERSSARPTVRC